MGPRALLLETVDPDRFSRVGRMMTIIAASVVSWSFILLAIRAFV